MKPVWHIYYLTRGTAGNYIDALMRAFRENGLPARAFVSARYRFATPNVVRCFFPVTDRTERRHVPVKAIRGVELLLAYACILLVAAFRRPRINLHLVDDFQATGLFFRWLVRMGLQVDITCHDVIPQYTGMSSRRRRMYRDAHRLIVHSAAAKRMLARQVGDEICSKIVSYPFPSRAFDEILSMPRLTAARQEIDRLVGERTRYVLFLRVVHPNKGIDLLLDAWRQTACPDVRLVIAGKWVQVPAEVRALAEELDNCIVIDRFVSDELFVALIQGAHVVVLPYREYAHSAILHACGRHSGAVVVSDIDLFTEQLSGYELTFRSGDRDDLLRVLRSALARSDAEIQECRTVLRDSLAKSERGLASAVNRAYSEQFTEADFERIEGAEPRKRTDPLNAWYYRAAPPAFQNVALSLGGWRQKWLRHGSEFQRELHLLEQSEQYSADELGMLQNERLQRLIDGAYRNVPYYRALFDDLRLRPSDIRQAADLGKLPVLEKRAVAEAGPRMWNTALPEAARIPGQTSGSTGTSLALVYDSAALAAEWATVWRLRRRFGCDLGRWHATLAGRLVVPVDRHGPPFHRVNYAQKQMLFSLYHLRRETAAAYAKALASRPHEFYSGYPSALEALAAAAVEAQVQLPGPKQALFPSSESLLLWQKERLEAAYGVPVYDRYGCAEFCVSFTVCPEGRYHLDSEFSIVEWNVIEEDDESITGELLCTGLMNHAMPFIRYRVGDVATIAKSPCPCGRASLSAYSIDGRAEDFVITRSGVRLGRLDHLFKDMPRIRESQIQQSAPGKMTIRIVRAPEYGVTDEQKLLAECAARMGNDMEVELDYIDTIPRNRAGKFRAVVNTMVGAQRYGN